MDLGAIRSQFHSLYQSSMVKISPIKRTNLSVKRRPSKKINPCSDTSEVTINGIDVQPFLKWPGGKRWLIPAIIRLIDGYDYRTYREPFLGGGALFFALQPKQSILSDVNSELINVYRQVKYYPKLLITRLRSLPINKSTYNSLRNNALGRPLDRAVRFLYLNRTAFGGMYRLNQLGQFNVPFGGGERTTSPLWKYGLIYNAAKALRRTQLVACDFEESLSKAMPGDLIYCDPTYTVAHNNNGFIRYNERNFSWEDQKRLAQSCQKIAERGALVLVSNAFHNEVLKLFSPPQHLIVSRHSRLCPDVQHRKTIDEYLFIFSPPKDKLPSP
jgi:DNA adenine methylase